MRGLARGYKLGKAIPGRAGSLLRRRPGEFAEAIREEFGFDPSADPLWEKRTGGDRGGAGSISYGFHCPAEELDGVYDAHGSRRFPGRLRILNR